MVLERFYTAEDDFITVESGDSKVTVYYEWLSFGNIMAGSGRESCDIALTPHQAVVLAGLLLKAAQPAMLQIAEGEKVEAAEEAKKSFEQFTGVPLPSIPR